jgi:hypothetical protein
MSRYIKARIFKIFKGSTDRKYQNIHSKMKRNTKQDELNTSTVPNGEMDTSWHKTLYSLLLRSERLPTT